MSAGQLFLTLTVAILVCEPKKIPTLFAQMVKMISFCRHHYGSITAKFEGLAQQALQEEQLEHNRQKARDAET